MANRDPQAPPRDHTVAIIAGVVALFGMLVVLAIGLEWTDSPNTMAIIGILGTGIGAVVIGQVMQINASKQTTAKVEQATQVAKLAASTAEDTNTRTQNIEHALNGNFEPRVREIVGPLLDEKLDAKFSAFEASLDARIRAGITAVNANPDRIEEFDKRMTALVDTALDRREAMCKVPQAQRRSRR